MTRGEAYKILEKRRFTRFGQSDLLDALIELGLLKVDEPKIETIYGKIADAISDVKPLDGPADVRLMFNRHGLDIVEK